MKFWQRLPMIDRDKLPTQNCAEVLRRRPASAQLKPAQ